MQTETKTEKQEPQDEVEEVAMRAKYDTDMSYKHQYIWSTVVVVSLLQISGLIGLYRLIYHAKLFTVIWVFVIGFFVTQGVSVAAHRYYTHRSFKASLPLRILFIVCQTMSGQHSVVKWVKDHKIHHRYSDTDADPHNASRGFFFSHIGWYMARPHPLVRQKRRELDISELLQDKLVIFQYKYYIYLYIPLAIVIPVTVPIYFWNETFWDAFFVAYCLQYNIQLHRTSTGTSLSHIWGEGAYDKRIKATTSLISEVITLGDGDHNFHHAFPWDYRMAEHASVATVFLDVCSYLGLAYDFKVASPNIIKNHRNKYGLKGGSEMSAKKTVQFNTEQINGEMKVPGFEQES